MIFYFFAEFRYKCASTDEICGNGIDDDNDGGIFASLQPKLSIASGADSGWVEFTLRFAKANTTKDTILSLITGVAVDIVGNEIATYEAVGLRDVNYLYTDPDANLSYLTNGT